MRGAKDWLILTRLGPAVPDAEGRARPAVQGEPTELWGRLTSLNSLARRETEVALQLVPDAVAVAQVPTETQVAGKAVDDACQVQRVGAPGPLAGLWDVGAVLSTDVVLRLVLRRPKALRGRTGG